MRRLPFSLAALFLALIAQHAWSQEYVLKVKEEVAGSKTRLESVNTSRMEVTAEAGGKSVRVLEAQGVETMNFVETIVARKPGEKPTVVRRQYETAVLDRPDGKKSTLEIQGKTVLIERGEDGHTFRYEGGGDVEGEALDFLKTQFQMSDDLAEPDKLLRPKKPVRVGESWDLDIAPLARNYARTTPVALEEAKAKGRGKLTKVYARDGREFAVIEVEIEIPIKPGPQGAITAQAGSKMTLKQTIDGAFDGKSGTQTFESQMILDIVGDIDAGDRKVKGKMSLRGTYRAKATDLAPSK